MKTKLFLILLIFSVFTYSKLFSQVNDTVKTNPPIYIAFHWHMHQPIYMPYESVIQTQNSGVYSFSLYDVFLSRSGPYTSWPKDAVQKGITAGLGHLGAQVSLSGSLVENLNNLDAANIGFDNWKSSWNYITGQYTTLGNPRIDLVAFGYHHPLMGLIEYSDIRKQIQEHKSVFSTNFPGYTYSKGIFPPENAFSERMIPALVDEGLDWVFVDNIHFDRTAEGCPVGDQTGMQRPNLADVLMPDPDDWLQLNGLWAPIPISIQWAHQPHYVQYVDPSTREIDKMIAVPTSRYLGNEDGRGGFGALQYEAVMSQMESYNTDPDHPIIIVLHHDGDNYGGGTDSYYGSNFQAFVDWLQANPSRFVCTTVQDYVDMFPPETNDVIHVQDGSWSGADNGDPEFKKWNGDPGTYMGTPNYSPDRNSWGVVTAAKNIVQTAQQINPSSTYTTQAWHYYLNSQTSCYWYWDGTEMWDSHPARACNMAVAQALNVVNTGTDLTPPTIYIPQREPYNPGEIEWSSVGPMPSDFTVWTYVFDYNDLTSVKLKYRLDTDGTNDLTTIVNETYTGGSGVGTWQELTMSALTQTSITNPLPAYKADQYSAEIVGQENVLIDYYVEAIDGEGNIAKSPILHVWVGDGGGGISGNVSWLPEDPNLNEYVTITCTYATATTLLHWGVNNSGSTWITPNVVYYPENTTLFNGTGPAVQTLFTDPDSDGVFTVVLGPFNNAAQVINSVAFVIHDGSTWDNNGGQDYHITINNDPGDEPVGSNATIETAVNENYTFNLDDFYFVGNNGATFSGIKIVSVETAGDLEYSNIDVITETDYSTVGNLVFKPDMGALGEPYATFTFKVKDSNGNYSVAAYTMTINVYSLNPTSGDCSVTLMLDDIFSFSDSNFPFSSNAGASFAGIQITELNSVGTLQYNGSDVILNTDYSDVSLLEFTPVTGASGTPYTSFNFKVKDSEGLYSVYSSTMIINVLEDIPTGVSWFPENPTQNDVITILIENDPTLITNGGKLHWGVNDWTMPNPVYRPAGTMEADGVVETTLNNDGVLYYLYLGPFNNPAQSVTAVDFVIHYGNNTWNNNGGLDWHIPIEIIEDVNENLLENAITVYPNPFSDFSFIDIADCNNSKYEVILTDVTGKIIKNEIFESNSKYILYRNNLEAGLYLIQFTNLTNGKVFNEKIMIY
jgi:hypothetical protein